MVPGLLVPVLLLPIQGLETVDGGVVSGNKLTVVALNFSVEAPSAEWEWKEWKKENGAARQFVCENRETGAYVSMMAFSGRWDSFDEEALVQFKAGIAKPWKERGFSIDEVTHETASIHLPDAFRYRYRVAAPDGSTVYGFRYSVTAGRLYVFEAVSATNQEPAELGRLVASLRILVPPSKDPAQHFGMLLTFVYLVLLFALRLVAWLAHWVTGRDWNGWNWGCYAIVALTLIWAVYFWSQMPDDGDAGRQGEAFGAMVLGPMIWPLVFGCFMSRRFRRSRSITPSAS
jgi:hypothetical protein